MFFERRRRSGVGRYRVHGAGDCRARGIRRSTARRAAGRRLLARHARLLERRRRDFPAGAHAHDQRRAASRSRAASASFNCAIETDRVVATAVVNVYRPSADELARLASRSERTVTRSRARHGREQGHRRRDRRAPRPRWLRRHRALSQRPRRRAAHRGRDRERRRPRARACSSTSQTEPPRAPPSKRTLPRTAPTTAS